MGACYWLGLIDQYDSSFAPFIEGPIVYLYTTSKRITNQEIKFKGECCKIKLDLETFKILKEDLIFILISICN